jgi:hypothetical protein
MACSCSCELRWLSGIARLGARALPAPHRCACCDAPSLPLAPHCCALPTATGTPGSEEGGAGCCRPRHARAWAPCECWSALPSRIRRSTHRSPAVVRLPLPHQPVAAMAQAHPRQRHQWRQHAPARRTPARIRRATQATPEQRARSAHAPATAVTSTGSQHTAPRRSSCACGAAFFEQPVLHPRQPCRQQRTALCRHKQRQRQPGQQPLQQAGVWRLRPGQCRGGRRCQLRQALAAAVPGTTHAASAGCCHVVATTTASMDSMEAG